MNLKKTSVLNGFAVAIKMLIMLLINKILAVLGGPSLYGTVGQIQNVLMVFNTLGTGAMTTGVVKYCSGNEYQSNKVIHTSILVSIICSIIIALISLSFNEKLALYFLGDVKYSFIFTYLSLSVVFSSLNMTFLSILNGMKEIASYIKCSILGNFLSLLMVLVLSYKLEFEGALIALVTYQCFAFCITFYTVLKKDWFDCKLIGLKVDKDVLLSLGQYATMALVTAIVVPMSLIMIRDFLSVKLGDESVGNWEAMWRLSKAYLSFFTLTLSVYFLPKFSSLETFSGIRKELFEGYKFIIPISFFVLVLIYFFKTILVNLLFSAQFTMLHSLFKYHLIGDFFKILAFLISFVMLGKGLVKLYIITEVIFALSHYVFVRVFVDLAGFDGVSIAYMVNYLMYFVVLFYFVIYKKVDNYEC